MFATGLAIQAVTGILVVPILVCAKQHKTINRCRLIFWAGTAVGGLIACYGLITRTAGGW